MTTQEARDLEAKMSAEYKTEIEALVAQDIDRDEMIDTYKQITKRYALQLAEAHHGKDLESEEYSLAYGFFAETGYPMLPEKEESGPLPAGIRIGTRPAHWDK